MSEVAGTGAAKVPVPAASMDGPGYEDVAEIRVNVLVKFVKQLNSNDLTNPPIRF